MSKVVEFKSGDQLAEEAWERYVAAVDAMQRCMTFENGKRAAEAWHEFNALFTLPPAGGRSN